MCALRALVLYLGLLVAAVVVYTAALIVRPFSIAVFRATILCWNRFALVWARWCCGISYRVEGLEHIPAHGPYVVASNHQSAYETILFTLLFPRSVSVVKRSLLRIPFFGWGLAMFGSVPIDRDRPTRSMQRLFAAAADRFADDRALVLYPEGTRYPPGVTTAWQAGAAHVACRSGVPLIPVAHNAGHFWPKGLCKKAGVVSVVIGPAQDTTQRAAEVTMAASDWVAATRTTLVPPG